MNLKYLLYIAFPFWLSLAACQMNPKKQFEKIKTGMDKGQVLELMNSPQQTDRKSGIDRWTYIYYNDEVREEKQVHFAEGLVTYVGAPVQPAVSAEEQDALNEAANQSLEQMARNKKQESNNAFSNYEDEVRGTDQIRYMPDFKPVQ